MKNPIKLKTSMTCESCVLKVKPALEALGIADSLQFNIHSPDKTIDFVGSEKEQELAIAALENLGFKARPMENILVKQPKKTSNHNESQTDFLQTYKPLIVVAAFIVGVTILVEVKAGSFNFMRSMNIFMGSFFIFFSFFKFLGLSAFADAFSTYDIVAKKFRSYALVYPTVELALGVGYILGVYPTIVNSITIALMVIGNIGVWGILQKRKPVQCACLGTIFKFPMTKVSLFENTLMLVMACFSLLKVKY